MATLDTAARNSILDDFGAAYAGATLVILDGAVALATHTLAGFAVAAAGSMTASAIATATIAASGTADGATITSADGVVTLTVGTSGADLNLSTLTYVSGETSTISSLVITKAA